MRSWERKDIIDILIAYHKELSEASAELSDGGSSCQLASGELDDDCIVIENFLEEDFGIWWDGLKFRRPKENIERMKGRSLKDYANHHRRENTE